MQPGFYQQHLHRVSYGEIFRAHPLLFPLAAPLIKWRKQKAKLYLRLPHSWRDDLCAETDVPPALRDRLHPLIAVIQAAGFTRESWSLHRDSVNSVYDLQAASLQFHNGVDTQLEAITLQANASSLHAMVDHLVLIASSHCGPDGPKLVTRSDAKGIDLPRVDTRLEKTADPLVLLRAHRARVDALGGRCRMDYPAFLAANDAINAIGNEDQVRRGIYQFVCATRAELDAIIGPRTAAGTVTAAATPDISSATADPNPYAPPSTAATQAQGLLPIGADTRRHLQIRADGSQDLAEFSLAADGLTVSGHINHVLADADAICRIFAIAPREGGAGFTVRKTRRVFAIPRDFLHLLLRQIDARRLAHLVLRQIYRRSLVVPMYVLVLLITFTAMFSVNTRHHGALIVNPGTIMMLVASAVLAVHMIVVAIASLRPRLGWYRAHNATHLIYAAGCILGILIGGSWYLILPALLMVIQYYVGKSNLRFIEEIQAAASPSQNDEGKAPRST